MTGRARNDARSRYTTCVCGKRGYSSRRIARKAAKQGFPGGGGLAAYRCHRRPLFWHLGHLNYTRDEYRRLA